VDYGCKVSTKHGAIQQKPGRFSAVAQSIVSQWRAAKQGGAPRSYQLVGALALATSLDSEDLERRDAFNDGIDWAMGTATEVDGTPVGLAADPSAVLAVVTALLATSDHPRLATMHSWLASVIDMFDARLGLWERAQLHVAAHLLGEKRLPPPELDSLFCVTRPAYPLEIEKRLEGRLRVRGLDPPDRDRRGPARQ